MYLRKCSISNLHVLSTPTLSLVGVSGFLSLHWPESSCYCTQHSFPATVGPVINIALSVDIDAIRGRVGQIALPVHFSKGTNE